MVALRHKHLVDTRRLAPGAPYPENADRPESKVDGALLRTWGTVAPFLPARQRARLGRFVGRVERNEADLTGLRDRQLRQKASEVRRSLLSSRSTLDELAVAFALAREATRRHTGMRHFPVQLLGGTAMMSGAIAEMQTGEGKTLTAVLPAVTAALMGRSVHIVTVNDYLARRDAEQLRPVYAALGLTVGLVEHGQQHQQRRQAYASDITYCTNKELVFDYLRDRLALGDRRAAARLLMDDLFRDPRRHRSEKLVLRGLQFAIIDEADSVLVDEARTPLILSGAPGNAENDDQLYETALDLAGCMTSGEDFRRVEGEKTMRLTEQGERKVAELVANLPGLWTIRRAREELVQQALCALHMFRRDQQYIVAQGKVQIVDEYTGRTMPDRSWQHGLHQLIEAKEHCAITKRHYTLSRITYQRFFRRYLHLCGMTGTAIETSGELRAVYGLRVVPIPTNRPVRTIDAGVRIFSTAALKWTAVVDEAIRITQQGRAVLIGTRSVEASEHVGNLLSAAGLAPVILNARQDQQEAEIVARAGQPRRVTVATNMAGRGTDIALDPAVKAAGGLHVILTEFHESRRIDRQLFGRAGRQGDPGSCEAITALDDELFERFAGRLLLRLVAALPRKGRTQHVPNAIAGALRVYSQSAAERTHAHVRRTALMEDERFNELLSFAGVE